MGISVWTTIRIIVEYLLVQYIESKHYSENAKSAIKNDADYTVSADAVDTENL